MAKKGFPVTNSIVLPEGRASFTNHLLVPEEKTNERTGDKYNQWGCAMLYPHGTDLSVLKRLAEEAISLAWPDAASRPRKFNVLIKDGDNGDHTKDGIPAGEKWAGYAGHNYFSLVSYRQPGVVHQRDIQSPIINGDEIYGGMWGRAQIAAQAYQTQGGCGVRLYLQNFMKTRDDEKLGGGGEAPSSAFASFVEDRPAETSSAPAASEETNGGGMW